MRNQSFDWLSGRLANLLALMQADFHEAAAKIALGMKRAYRAATLYQELLGYHGEEFGDWIEKNYGCKGKSRFDDFVEKLFAPMRLADLNPWEIIHAVANGISEKQFLAEGARGFAARKRREQNRRLLAQGTRVPVDPEESLSDRDQLEQCRVIIRTLRSENDELRRSLRESTHRLALVENELVRILRRTKNAEAVLANKQ